MSLAATIILRAACDSITHLEGQTFQYIYEENARARDLVKFVADKYALEDDYMYQIKCKTLDMNGKQKIITLVPASLVNEEETYFMIISPRDDIDAEINPSQMVPQSPMTPRTSQQHQRIFGNFSTPSRSLSAFSFDSPPSTVHPFPGSQTSQYIDPTSYNTTPRAPTRQLQRIIPTNESSEILVTSAVQELRNRTSLVQFNEDTATGKDSEEATASLLAPMVPGSHETSASIGGSRSTETSAMEKKRLSYPMNYVHGVNRGKFLGMIYSQNQTIMDEAFAGMTREPFLFYGIDIIERMRNPRNIAALVLIGPSGFADYDIRVGQVARDVSQKFLIDLVMEIRKNNPMTRDTVRPLVKHLNEITQGTFFDYLVTPDGPLFAAIRKREARNSASNGFIPAKKLRFMLSDVPMEDVEKAANAAAAAQTQEEVTAIVKNSSTARCLWIAKMVKEDKAKIPEIVVAKFPMFKTNGAWLQHDFAYTLENIYKLPVFSVSKTLESFAPAIAALAYDHRILSSDDQSDVSNDLHRTTELLLQLIGIYFKKKVNASLDRLVISSQGLPSVDEMIDRRRAIKQIAPMIFIIETAHGNDYFVSTDDFALKVHENFGDALHCLTALHYVLYIEYAKELLHFNLLLENLCGINIKKMPKGRLNLKMDLETKMQNISQETP